MCKFLLCCLHSLVNERMCLEMLFTGPDLWLVDAMTPHGAVSTGAATKRPPVKRKSRSVGVGPGPARGCAFCVACTNGASASEVLRQYSEEACVHGIHYFTKREITLPERLMWVGAVSVCAVFAVLFMHIAWTKYMSSPIVTRVQTTFYPLYRLPFPAVTVCPSTNVRRTVGEQLLLRHLGESRANDTMKHLLYHAMAALSKMQHPFFQTMDSHLAEATPLIPRLRSFNISHFMLEVLPPCKDVFEKCFWQGREVTCCEEFRLQRFDGGLCYAFNSLTTDYMSKCNAVMAVPLSEGVGNSSEDCLLRHNTAYGSATGLELLLRHSAAEDNLGEGQRLGEGHRVLVHQPTEFPEEGSSIFVPHQRFGASLDGVVKVSPSLTESGLEVRALSPSVRGCLFPDERRLLVSTQYSLPSCLLECRLRHLASRCGCLPYFFASLPLPEASGECNFQQLQCLSNHSADLRFYRPPERMRGAEGRLSERLAAAWGGPRGIDCSHCLPACHDSTYDLETDVTTDNQISAANNTYLEVFYKDITAVKYARELAFGKTELLVSLGGIVSLFLGVSLLSAVEVVYYAAKLLMAAGGGVRRRKRTSAAISPHTHSARPSPAPWTLTPPGEVWSARGGR